MSQYTVVVSHDPDVDDPTQNCGSWRIYSFGRRHINRRDVGDFFNDNGKPHLRVANKLRVGLAFMLSYHEHGSCVWSLRGEGPQCRWDTVDVAGIAVWEEKARDLGAKTPEARCEDCRVSLRRYTDWCNGCCYAYAVVDESGETVDSCGGFIGSDDITEAVRESFATLRLVADNDDINFTGEANGAVDRHKLFAMRAARV